MEEVLIQNGFSTKEAKVYLSILASGEIPFSRIATKTHLKRTTMYGIIEKLRDEGIVSLTRRSGIQYASCLSPRVLIERFKQSAQRAEELLPDLINMAYASPVKPRIRFFEREEGVKEVLSEFSFSKTPAMGFTDYHAMPKSIYTFIQRTIVPERRRHNNYARFILPDNETNVRVKREDSLRYSEHRIAHFADRGNPIELLLFGTSEIAFLSFLKEEMFGMIIDSPAIYKTIKNIFQFMWSEVRS